MSTATLAPPRAAARLDVDAALDALADTMASETRLLGDLAACLRRQRDAVADDDLQAMEDSVYATHRVLMTLGEARRRRRSLDELLRERNAELPAELLAARERLRTLAQELAPEVDALRQVLHAAMTSGEEQIRTLYGTAEGRAFYAGGVAPAPAGGVEGSLFNRRA